MKLYEYAALHTRRGACMCGRCADAVAHPERQQPAGHTVTVEFFDVAREGGDADEFRALAQAEFPEWFDGREHNFMEVGAQIGDQGLGLLTMALGSLLGVWTLLTPSSVLPSGTLSPEQRMELAGLGMITIVVPKGGVSA